MKNYSVNKSLFEHTLFHKDINGNKYSELSILEGIVMAVKNKNIGGDILGISLPFEEEDVNSVIDNAKVVANGLMNYLGWTLESACALLGIIMCESGFNPQAYNKGEKNGTNTSSGACNRGAPYGSKGSPWDYGAGLIQWTFVGRKDDVLRGVFNSKVKCSDYPIETLSISYQTMFIVWEFNTKWKALNRCILQNKNDLQQSLADLYCGYVGGYKQSHSSMADVEKLVGRYMGANPGSSKNSHFQKRLNYAMSFYNQLKQLVN